jgi:hypothetical protein
MAVAIELAGWAGALAVLLAYGLVSAERVSSRSWTYQLLNIGGAIGLVINSSWNGAIPSAVVNLHLDWYWRLSRLWRPLGRSRPPSTAAEGFGGASELDNEPLARHAIQERSDRNAARTSEEKSRGFLPGGEVPALSAFVEVGEAWIDRLDPAARGCPDLAGERREADRNLTGGGGWPDAALRPALVRPPSTTGRRWSVCPSASTA